jgi:hypothetical protein
MKKDQADEFERELMQPLAQALRTRLGDAGEVHVNNEPRPDRSVAGSRAPTRQRVAKLRQAAFDRVGLRSRHAMLTGYLTSVLTEFQLGKSPYAAPTRICCRG